MGRDDQEKERKREYFLVTSTCILILRSCAHSESNDLPRNFCLTKKKRQITVSTALVSTQQT